MPSTCITSLSTGGHHLMVCHCQFARWDQLAVSDTDRLTLVDSGGKHTVGLEQRTL